MRGGGPMVTLLDPGWGLWPLIWANVPDGVPGNPEVLPWMRSTRTSENGQQVFPQDAHPAEAFFAMPRRLRLVAEQGAVIGVVQRPYGANYVGWEHPLTPHYRQKPGGDLFSRHPRAGAFGYRNWLGVAALRKDVHDMTRRAQVIDLWAGRSLAHAEVIVAGWAMDNMKPLDFIYSRAPLINLSDELADRIEGLVNAAEGLAISLRWAFTPMLAEGEAREVMREAFFVETQGAFEARLTQSSTDNPDDAARGWLRDMENVALALFDAQAQPGLADRNVKEQAKVVLARANLAAAFKGYGKRGRAAYQALGLPVPEQKRSKAA